MNTLNKAQEKQGSFFVEVIEVPNGCYYYTDFKIHKVNGGPKGTPPEFMVSSGKLLKYNGNAKHILIPDTVHTIAKGAFRNADIISVSIPSSVQVVEEEAFYNCRNLKCIKFDGDVEKGLGCQYIGNRAFGGVAMPDARNGLYQFEDRYIVLPHSIRFIGYDALFLTKNIDAYVIEFYTTPYMAEYCADYGLDLRSEHNDIMNGPLNERVSKPKLHLCVHKSQARKVLAEKMEQFLFYDKDSIDRQKSISDYRQDIVDHENEIKKSEVELAQNRAEQRRLEGEISRLKGMFNAKKRRECEEALATLKYKAERTQQLIEARKKWILSTQGKINAILNKPENELLFVAERHIRQNFMEQIEFFRRIKAEKLERLRDPKYSTINDFPVAGEIPPLDHGPYGTAVNAGMPINGRMPHLGDIDVSDM